MQHQTIMRSLTISLILIAFCVPSMVAQNVLSPEQNSKLDAADKAAALIVEEFRKTRDFGTVWRKYRAADTRCAYRLTPVLGSYSEADLQERSFENRLGELGLDESKLEQIFVSSWNGSFLFQGYHYSYAYSRNASEPAEKPKASTTPTAIRALYKEMVREDEKGRSDDGRLSRKDIDDDISNSDRATAIFRKYAPKDFLLTANWKSAVEWFGRVHDVGRQIEDRSRYNDRCGPGSGPIYVSQIGFFVFLFTEENTLLKLWSISFIDN